MIDPDKYLNEQSIPTPNINMLSESCKIQNDIQIHNIIIIPASAVWMEFSWIQYSIISQYKFCYYFITLWLTHESVGV